MIVVTQNYEPIPKVYYLLLLSFLQLFEDLFFTVVV